MEWLAYVAALTFGLALLHLVLLGLPAVAWLVAKQRFRAWTMVAAGSEAEDAPETTVAVTLEQTSCSGGARGGARIGVDAPARRLRLGRRGAGRGPRDPPPPARRGWLGRAQVALMGYWRLGRPQA